MPKKPRLQKPCQYGPGRELAVLGHPNRAGASRADRQLLGEIGQRPVKMAHEEHASRSVPIGSDPVIVVVQAIFHFQFPILRNVRSVRKAKCSNRFFFVRLNLFSINRNRRKRRRPKWNWPIGTILFCAVVKSSLLILINTSKNGALHFRFRSV